jgi:hypothetical protein
MNIKIGNSTYTFQWYYYDTDCHENIKWHGKDAVVRYKARATNCTVWLKNDLEPRDEIVGGTVVCRAIDVFNKDEGKRRAFGSAVYSLSKALSLTKAQRQTIWHTFQLLEDLRTNIHMYRGSNDASNIAMRDNAVKIYQTELSAIHII